MIVYQLMFVLIVLITDSSLAPVSGVCPEDHFKCLSGSCLPLAAVCDGIDHCGDQSDEDNEICQELDPRKAAVSAGQYILNQMTANYDWQEFTPRAVIALSFLKKVLIIPQEWEKIISKMNLRLTKLLREELPVHLLSLYINAQYATCQDPRDFSENDLVGILRKKTNEAMKSDFNLPIVILSLCLARETRSEDFSQLVTIYDKIGDRISLKALTIISMAACRNLAPTDLHREMENRVAHFMQRVQIKDNIGIYGKALIYQAMTTWGYDASSLARELLRLQSEDGGFGDLLTTYSAIPTLLNTSLADLKCKGRNYESTRRSVTTSVQISNPRFIELSLSIPYGQNQGNHSLRVTYQGRKSLDDLMQQAKDLNLLFNFTYDELKGHGKKVNSIAGILNDAETSLSWTLYRRSSDMGNLKDVKMIKESGDIDFIYPVDGEHFLFKLEYSE